MARTRRKHSYRKSRRWNPSARPGENQIDTVRIGRPGAKNPRGGSTARYRAKLLRAEAVARHHRGKYGVRSRRSKKWHRAGERVKRRYLQAFNRRNPRGRSSRASRARSWHKKVRSSLPWWEKGHRNPGRKHRTHKGSGGASRYRAKFAHALAMRDRHDGFYGGKQRSGRRNKWVTAATKARRRFGKAIRRGNPRKGSYYSGRKSTRRSRNPRSGSYYRAKRHLKSLSRSRRKHVVSYALGQMNPRGHRGHRRKNRSWIWKGPSSKKGWRKYKGQRRSKRTSLRNPAQFPMPFVSAMNPRRRRSRRGRR